MISYAQFSSQCHQVWSGLRRMNEVVQYLAGTRYKE